MKEFASVTVAGSDAMPAVGLGLWKIEQSKTSDVVCDALEAGYRHLDAACDYGNELQAGQGIQRALSKGICQREDLWVTSKLWNTYHRPEHVRPALERSLADLQLDYLDLYLIHFPIALMFVDFERRYPPGWFFDEDVAQPKMELDAVPLVETWAAMEELQHQGLVKHLGVCNFGTSLLRDLLSYASLRPAVLQVESHPYLVQPKLLKFCQLEGIAYTAFSPLGAGSYVSLGMASEDDSVLNQPGVQAIAEAHGKTPAQVVLRWGIQRGTAVIPKSVHAERIRENIAVFDFELSDEEMATISGLNRHQRFNDPGEFCESGFGCFCPIYE